MWRGMFEIFMNESEINWRKLQKERFKRFKAWVKTHYDDDDLL